MPTRLVKIVLQGVDQASPTFARVKTALAAVGTAAVAVGAYQIGQKLVSGLQSAVQAAAEQEQADNRLAAALQRTGQATEANWRTVKQLAESRQRLTRATDDEIEGAQAILIRYGAQVSTLGKLIPAVQDFAAETGDLESATLAVAKAIGGNAAGLQRYTGALKLSGDAAERTEQITAALLKRFGGAEAAQVDTLAGALKRAANTFGELQEQIGGPFGEVTKAFVQNVLIPLGQTLGSNTEAAKQFRTAILDLGQAFASAMQAMIGGLAKLSTGLGGLSELEGFFRFVNPQAATALRLFIALGPALTESADGFGAMHEALEKIKKIEPGAMPKQMGEAWKEVSQEITGFVGPTLDMLTELVQNVDVAARGLEITLQDAAAALGEGGLGELGAQILQARTGVEDLGTAVTRTVRGQAISGAINLGDALVDAAVRGKAAWGDFLQQLIIDFAKAIVQALILKTIVGIATSGVGGVASFASGLIGGAGGVEMRRGGILGARRGVLIPGSDVGRDTVLFRGRPGEAVLPRELTELLTSAALGGRRGGGITIDARGALFSDGSFTPRQMRELRKAVGVGRG